MAPFVNFLPQIAARAPSDVQHTITGYQRSLKRSAATTERAIIDLSDLAARFRSRAAIWRYDPIMLTTLILAKWHLENFTGIAQRLEGIFGGASNYVQSERQQTQLLI